MTKRNAITQRGFPTTSDAQLSLPLTPDHLRAVPWVALRSALFAPVKRGARDLLSRQPLATVGDDWKIIYSGARLDQADLDVLEQVLHIARTGTLGELIQFRTRDMLQALNRSTGKSDRDWLLASLARLQACAIEFKSSKDPSRSYTGSLIQEQGRVDAEDGTSGKHFVAINPRLTSLYSAGYTQLDWNERMALGSNQLAKWLHGFMHQGGPLTWKVENLRALSNSNYARDRDFRDAMNSAAAAVNAVRKTRKLLLKWDKDKVTMTVVHAEKVIEPPAEA